MILRNQLISFIHKTVGPELIAKVKIFDSRANGLQVIGKDKVSKVALGVSVSLDFLKEAIATKADFCIFHHGLGISPRDIANSFLNLATQKRLKYIFLHNLNIAAYHASLDMQPQLGNNAVIIRKLGAKRLDMPYFENWGWVAEFSKAQDVEKLAVKCADIFEHEIFAVYAGPKKVKRIGVCSGGGKPSGESLLEISEKNIDLHITGEIAEGGASLAKDVGFNYFAGGHYATEVFGVQELGKAIKSHFKDKIQVEFIDIPNPI